MNKVLLEARHLEKRFHVGDEVAIATQDFSFSFAPTGLYCLVGESGSGKTTLLNELSGLLRPDEGEVLFEGDSLYGDPKRSKRRKDAFSYVFQEGNLLEEKTVLENLLLSSRERTAIQKALERFHVLDKMDSPVARLSGGEKQRVAIARSFLRGTKVLILDEPTASLDKENGEKVFQAIQEASKSSLCIVSTHNRELAESYADVLLFLEDGRLKETKGEGAGGNVASDKGEPSKGRIPLLFGWKSLWRRKAKAIATLAVSSLAMLFVIAGASFSFYDPEPAFEDAIKAADTWFLPLEIKEYSKRQEADLTFRNGAYLNGKLEEAFGSDAFPYQIGHVRDARTALNIVPYAEGMEIHGTKIQEPGPEEVVISSFFREVVKNDSFPISSSTCFGYQRFRVSQVVPVSYSEETFYAHLQHADYQAKRKDYFDSFLSYAIVSEEGFRRLGGQEIGTISLLAADCFDESLDIDAYLKRNVSFSIFSEEIPLLCGRGPQNDREIVAPLSKLNLPEGSDPSSALGKKCRFRDLRALVDPVPYLATTNVFDVVQEVEIVGVTAEPSACLSADLFDALRKAEFENQVLHAIRPRDPASVARVLSEAEIVAPSSLFSSIYQFNAIKGTGVGTALLVVEGLFVLLMAAAGFSSGQDNVSANPKEIALLLTLGFEEKDLIKRCFLGQALFLLCAFGIGLLLSGVGILSINLGFLNPETPFALFHLSYLGVLLAFGISILAALWSTMGSLHRLSKLQIADIFRGKE
ncbi:MAG: ATP-binding cassette domain-containing protein [Candidatus Enteromonas sp.]